MEPEKSLWEIYRLVNEWVRFADAKATAILAINGVILAVIGASINDLKGLLIDQPLVLWLVVFALSFLLVSIVLALASLLPITSSSKIKSSIFFGAIAQDYDKPTDYQVAVKASLESEKGLAQDLLGQIWTNSKISALKYKYISFATYSLTIAITIGIIVFGIAFYSVLSNAK